MTDKRRQDLGKTTHHPALKFILGNSIKQWRPRGNNISEGIHHPTICRQLQTHMCGDNGGKGIGRIGKASTPSKPNTRVGGQ